MKTIKQGDVIDWGWRCDIWTETWMMQSISPLMVPEEIVRSSLLWMQMTRYVALSNFWHFLSIMSTKCLLDDYKWKGLAHELRLTPLDRVVDLVCFFASVYLVCLPFSFERCFGMWTGEELKGQFLCVMLSWVPRDMEWCRVGRKVLSSSWLTGLCNLGGSRILGASEDNTLETDRCFLFIGPFRGLGGHIHHQEHSIYPFICELTLGLFPLLGNFE